MAYYYFYMVVIGVWDLFFSCPLFFFAYSRLSSYVLRLFLYLVSFLLFPCASVWETLLHEFLISYSHIEWYLLFPTVQLQVHN